MAFGEAVYAADPSEDTNRVPEKDDRHAEDPVLAAEVAEGFPPEVVAEASGNAHTCNAMLARITRDTRASGGDVSSRHGVRDVV